MLKFRTLLKIFWLKYDFICVARKALHSEGSEVTDMQQHHDNVASKAGNLVMYRRKTVLSRMNENVLANLQPFQKADQILSFTV